jgi:hypothetical protein
MSKETMNLNELEKEVSKLSDDKLLKKWNSLLVRADDYQDKLVHAKNIVNFEIFERGISCRIIEDPFVGNDLIQQQKAKTFY